MEYSTDFMIEFVLFNEDRNDYDHWKLNLEKIIELNSDKIILSAESSIEIISFDYSKNDHYEGRIVFLLGFGQPSFTVEFKCEYIELINLPPQNNLKRESRN